jgi:hypothetical protein
MDFDAGANAIAPDHHINCAFDLSSIPPTWKKPPVDVEEAAHALSAVTGAGEVEDG